MVSPLRRGRAAGRQRAQATHEPAMGLRTDRLGGPRGERDRRTPCTWSATASGGSCPGTRFRGIIALSVRVNPTDGQTLRRGPEIVKTIYSFLHSRTIFIYKRRSMKPLPGIGQLQVFKAEFFKALAHPLRIRVLEILVNGERSVHELQAILGVDQPTVSQQLAVLRAKNIVDARKEGTVVRYAVRDAALGDLLAVARRIFNRHLIGTQTMLRELRRESRRR